VGGGGDTGGEGEVAAAPPRGRAGGLGGPDLGPPPPAR